MFVIRSMRRAAQRVCRDLRLRTLVLIVSACTWWSILYPELCFADGTYERVGADSGEETAVKGKGHEAAEGGVSGILRASDDEIVIGSRLLEWIEQKIERQ